MAGIDPKVLENALSPIARQDSEYLAFAGLLSRRSRWGLSRRGLMILFGALAGVITTLVLWVHPFLAVTAPVMTEVLVVEGWIPNDALKAAIQEFRSHHYRMMICTGGPLHSSIQIDPGDTYAHSAADRLQRLGLPREEIRVVPSPSTKVDRTYAAAAALRLWARQQPTRLQSFNLVTLGPHARRSRLLYEKAFGDQTKVGIIAIPDSEYNPGAWWKYSEGTKSVIGEAIGYVYARFFFRNADTQVQ